jgi:hypothetical protein
MMKTLVTESLYLYITKHIYSKVTDNIFHGKELKMFSLTFGTPNDSTSTTFIKHNHVSLFRAKERSKGHLCRKEFKMTLCADDTTLYMENSEHSIKYLLQRIKEFRKDLLCKISSLSSQQ